MKRTTLVFILAMAVAAPLHAAAPGTIRVDYYHTGNDKSESFSLDQVVLEPLPWPGNVAKDVDTTNLGKYFFEVADAETGTVLYSRGFASIYGEWETTGEAKSMNRTFSESLRFPAVEKKARVTIRKRDQRNAFKDVWSFASIRRTNSSFAAYRRQTPAPSSSFTRRAILPRSWTSWCSATDIRPPSGASSSATPGGC